MFLSLEKLILFVYISKINTVIIIYILIRILDLLGSYKIIYNLR